MTNKNKFKEQTPLSLPKEKNMTEQNERIINSSVKMLTISEDESGQRIDNYLLAKLKGVPKSLIYRIVRKGEVRVNKGRIKPEYTSNR